MQIQYGNRKNYIVGLYSYYFANSNPLTLVYTRITHYLDWIENHVWPEYIKVNNDDDSDLIYQNCGERKISNKIRPLQTYAFKTSPGEFPWHVAIYRRIRFGTKEFICGGTLINPNTVVTAAHCISVGERILSPDVLTVELGKFELDISGQITTRVTRIIENINFDFKFFDSDIALLKLLINVPFSTYIQPICITNNFNIFESNIGTVPGWGENENHELSNEITKLTMPIHSNRECRDSNEPFFTRYLNEFNFCAGYKNGTSVCSGDSGSGMVFENNGKWYLRGIVSLGVSLANETRCDITQNVLFTNVPKFYDWIKGHL